MTRPEHSVADSNPERQDGYLGSVEIHGCEKTEQAHEIRAVSDNPQVLKSPLNMPEDKLGTLNVIAEARQNVSNVVAVLPLRHQPRSPAYRALQCHEAADELVDCAAVARGVSPTSLAIDILSYAVVYPTVWYS